MNDHVKTMASTFHSMLYAIAGLAQLELSDITVGLVDFCDRNDEGVDVCDETPFNEAGPGRRGILSYEGINRTLNVRCSQNILSSIRKHDPALKRCPWARKTRQH